MANKIHTFFCAVSTNLGSTSGLEPLRDRTCTSGVVSLEVEEMQAFRMKTERNL